MKEPQKAEKIPEKKQEKNPVGRPTKYSPEICNEMISFFSKELYEVRKKTVIVKGRKFDVDEHLPCKLPTFESFAVHKKLADSTIRLWKEKHEEFSAAYEICKKIQKDILIHHGLLGNYNAAFAKFVAINCTDMKDGNQDNTLHQDITINVSEKDMKVV